MLTEAAAGDEDAARARLTALEVVTRIDTTEAAATLTRKLLELGAFPREAVADAAHVRTSAGVEHPPFWCRRSGKWFWRGDVRADPVAGFLARVCVARRKHPPTPGGRGCGWRPKRSFTAPRSGHQTGVSAPIRGARRRRTGPAEISGSSTGNRCRSGRTPPG